MKQLFISICLSARCRTMQNRQIVSCWFTSLRLFRCMSYVL
nr:MAG TPA: hypothetical protein [Caudoviricetes sp.]